MLQTLSHGVCMHPLSMAAFKFSICCKFYDGNLRYFHYKVQVIWSLVNVRGYSTKPLCCSIYLFRQKSLWIPKWAYLFGIPCAIIFWFNVLDLMYLVFWSLLFFICCCSIIFPFGCGWKCFINIFLFLNFSRFDREQRFTSRNFRQLTSCFTS